MNRGFLQVKGTFKPFLGKTPKTEHFDKWYGVQAYWHKIPKYLALGLLFVWLLGQFS